MYKTFDITTNFDSVLLVVILKSFLDRGPSIYDVKTLGRGKGFCDDSTLLFVHIGGTSK